MSRNLTKDLPGSKPKNVQKTVLRLLTYIKPHRMKLVWVVVAAFSILFNVISPKYLGEATSTLFDSVTQNTPIPFDVLGRIILLLAGLYMLSSLFTLGQHYLVAGVAQNTMATIRTEVNQKLSRLPLTYFDQHTRGDILSRAVNDVDNMNQALQQVLTQVITSFFTILGIVIMMLVISPMLTLVVGITVPLSILLVRWIASHAQQHFVRQQQELGTLNGHIEEMITGHQVVKAYSYESRAIARFDEMNHRLYAAGRRAQFISGILMPLMFFINYLGYAFVSIVGGYLVLNHTIRIGDVQAFIQYTQQISQPLSQAASIANLIQSAIASAERIFLLLDEEEERKEYPAAVAVDQLNGSVQFQNVSFGYSPGETIIEDLSMDVNEGDRVAIVGPTGAGKTTLINLLMRFYELDKGSISVGGIDLNRLSREQTRSLFGMVLQDTWLFNGTIRENIGYGNPNATEEEIYQAAKSAYADDFIRTLPEGYDTVLQEDAANLSQGQQQLLIENAV